MGVGGWTVRKGPEEWSIACTLQRGNYVSWWHGRGSTLPDHSPLHTSNRSSTAQIMQTARFYGRLGCPVPYLSLRFGGERARRWASLVLGWGASRVLCCHFDPEVPQGPEELQRCLSFLV